MLISCTLYKIETFETYGVKIATVRSTACKRQPIATCFDFSINEYEDAVDQFGSLGYLKLTSLQIY